MSEAVRQRIEELLQDDATGLYHKFFERMTAGSDQIKKADLVKAMAVLDLLDDTLHPQPAEESAAEPPDADTLEELDELEVLEETEDLEEMDLEELGAEPGQSATVADEGPPANGDAPVAEPDEAESTARAPETRSQAPAADEASQRAPDRESESVGHADETSERIRIGGDSATAPGSTQHRFEFQADRDTMEGGWFRKRRKLPGTLSMGFAVRAGLSFEQIGAGLPLGVTHTQTDLKIGDYLRSYELTRDEDIPRPTCLIPGTECFWWFAYQCKEDETLAWKSDDDSNVAGSMYALTRSTNESNWWILRLTPHPNRILRGRVRLYKGRTQLAESGRFKLSRETS